MVVGGGGWGWGGCRFDGFIKGLLQVRCEVCMQVKFKASAPDGMCFWAAHPDHRGVVSVVAVIVFVIVIVTS